MGGYVFKASPELPYSSPISKVIDLGPSPSGQYIAIIDLMDPDFDPECFSNGGIEVVTGPISLEPGSLYVVKGSTVNLTVFSRLVAVRQIFPDKLIHGASREVTQK
jgi:hypothetical protein